MPNVMTEVRNHGIRSEDKQLGETSPRAKEGMGVESPELMRWDDPDRGSSTPGDYCYDDLQQAKTSQRNSSLGASLMTDYDNHPTSTANPTRSEQQFFMNTANGKPICHRPMVGGGAAAAYEALRHDFYIQKRAKLQRRLSSLSFGSAKGCAASYLRSPVNPEEQYEMLKLHHLNLMNEIQETALMLNLCEQQELVRQQREQMQQIQQLKCSRRQEQHDTPVQQPQLLLQQQSAEYKSYDKHCARAPSCSEVKTEDRPSGRTSTGSYDTIRDNDEKLAYRINQAEEPVSLQKRAVCDVSAPNKRQKQNDHTIRVGK